MASTIPSQYVYAFKDNLISRVQQRGSKLRQFIAEDVLNGVYLYYRRLAKTTAAYKTSRNQPTPITESSHDVRRVSARVLHWAQLIDPADVRRMMLDPEGKYVKNGSDALGRQIDDAIIAAFFATVETGLDGSGTAVFDTNMSIASSVGPTAGLNVDKLRQAAYLLDANDVPEEGRHFATHPAGKHQLLSQTETTSSDYAAVKALVKGEINSFYGFEFHWTTRFVAAASEYASAFWHEDGMSFALSEDMKVRVDERPDLSYSEQVYCEVDFGVMRVEEEMVGRCYISSTVAS